jgi:hypothetical protein
MTTKYVMAGLSIFFLLIGIVRLARDGGRWRPQSRAWLLTGAIFGAVGTYLFSQG